MLHDTYYKRFLNLRKEHITAVSEFVVLFHSKKIGIRMQPYISVIIPTYNRKEMLKKCLKSVLSVNYPKYRYEVIVIDDGSTDGTYEFLMEVAKEHQNLRILRQENRGPAAARNLGIRNAKGEILFFTDDDCVVPKDWIKIFLEVFEEYPEIAGVGGYLEAPNEILKSNIFARYESLMSEILYKPRSTGFYIGGVETPCVVTNNCAYKKEVLKEVGGFDENFSVAAGEDADLKLRICLKGYKLAYVPIKVEHYHEYTFNRFIKQTITRKRGDIYFMQKWSKYLEERRKKEGIKYKDNLLFLKLLRFGGLKYSIIHLSLKFVEFLTVVVMWWKRLR